MVKRRGRRGGDEHLRFRKRGGVWGGQEVDDRGRKPNLILLGEGGMEQGGWANKTDN